MINSEIQAYSEVYAILEKFKLKNKIPMDLIEKLEEKKDNNWNFNLKETCL